MPRTNEKPIISKRPLDSDANTAIPDGNGDLSSAKQVCTNCKQRKKRCDKRLPCCSYCTRRRITCTYDSSDNKSAVRELQQLRERLEKVENSITVQSQACSEASGSISSNKNSITSWMGSLPDARSWDTSVAGKVRQIIEHKGNSITASCATYFQHIHRWMPVISEKLFYDNLRGPEISPRADFSLLTLCIHLMIQVPAGDAKVMQMQESLYLTTKCLYVCLQALLPQSIASLQAGLLIATFEHASGLCEEAYMTIGGCARASFLMRLSRTPGREVHGDTNAWLKAVEAKNLWWGILIRDRAINREPQIQGLPLAVEDPNPFDELPSEVDDWSASSGQILTLGNSLNAATESTLSVGSFGREAQACCLFNRVMKVLNNPSMVTLERESVIQALDRDIRKFLGLLMDESSGSWGTFCGSTAMTLASFYALHEQQDPSANDRSNHQDKQSLWSELALNYISRIVIDVARAFNTNFSSFNMTAIPPGYTYIIFRAAQQHIRSSSHLGKNYLREIDNAVKAVTDAPLCEYTGFISPQGDRSGLC
ncbi:hypothetical protein V8E51_000349 [Hyaloscypha variabilis]